MSTNLITTPEYLPLAPESIEIANTYLETMDMYATAQQLDLPISKVAEYIAKPEVQRYITEVYLNSGYRNRFKIAKVMDNIIERKIIELEEAGITSSKDIADIIALAHKMRMDEIDRLIELEKARSKKPSSQTNIQINQGGPKKSIFETLVEDHGDL